jgi:Rod binding domain-containing protein
MPPGLTAEPPPVLQNLQAAGASPANDKDPRAVAQACLECEAMFISLLTKQLRQGILSGELAAAHRSTEQFWAIGDQEFSRHLAASGGLGLGRWLFTQLSRPTVKNPTYNAARREGGEAADPPDEPPAALSSEPSAPESPESSPPAADPAPEDRPHANLFLLREYSCRR